LSSLRIQAAPAASAAAASLPAALPAPHTAASDGNRGVVAAAIAKDPALARKDSITATSASPAGSGEGSATAASSSDGQRFPSERHALADEVSGRCPSPKTATKVLAAIGTTLRSKADKFVDVASFPLQEVNMNEKRRGASVFFPEILHRLLAEAERDGWSGTVVGWLPHHRAFRVHNKARFEKEILPKYFVGQTKVGARNEEKDFDAAGTRSSHTCHVRWQWSSFSRQLNLYGWLRVTSGPDYGTLPE
jgi:hypothetical protein